MPLATPMPISGAEQQGNQSNNRMLKQEERGHAPVVQNSRRVRADCFESRRTE